jgi:hypothetical protein
LLAAIGEDVHRISGEVRASIMREFAGQMIQATRLTGSERVAAVAAIKQARNAALAAAKRNAADELAARRRATVAMRAKPRLREPSGG